MIGSELSVAVWIQCSKMSVGKRQQLMWEWPPLKHTLYLQIRYNAKTHTKKKIQKSCHTFVFRVDSIKPRYKTTARECEQLKKSRPNSASSIFSSNLYKCFHNFCITRGHSSTEKMGIRGDEGGEKERQKGREMEREKDKKREREVCACLSNLCTQQSSNCSGEQSNKTAIISKP